LQYACTRPVSRLPYRTRCKSRLPAGVIVGLGHSVIDAVNTLRSINLRVRDDHADRTLAAYDQVDVLVREVEVRRGDVQPTGRRRMRQKVTRHLSKSDEDKDRNE
jgi:hypothetical protein